MAEHHGGGLPARARRVIVASVAGAIAVIVVQTAASGGVVVGRLTEFGYLALLVSVSWWFPLVMYRNGRESESMQPDEGCFAVLAILLPPLGVIGAFLVAAFVSNGLHRRSIVKTAFNAALVTVSTGAGLAVLEVLHVPGRHLSLGDALAILAGAAVFAVVNTLLMAALISGVTSTSFRDAMFEGFDIRAVVYMTGTTLGLLSGLAVAADRWLLPVVFLPFLVIRQVLAGHFRSHHDRMRIEGLFAATLAAHQSMGAGEVEAAILAATGDLLRCGRVAITAEPGAPGDLGVPLPDDPQGRWLVVGDRFVGLPNDEADLGMLRTLAAVGAGALANATLYEEVIGQRERLGAITASLGEGVCGLDSAGSVIFYNPAAADLLGWAPPGEGGAPPGSELPHTPASLAGPALHCIRTATTVRREDATFERWDGTPLPVAFTCSPVMRDDRAVGAVVAFRDITERKAFEERLAHQAFHDSLTGLANRRLFLDHLDQALHRRSPAGSAPAVHAVLFMDVDRFKVVNDNLGHHAGDDMLVAIAERLRLVVRAGDTLARFGGDEFTLLLDNVENGENALAVAHRVQEELSDPIVLAGGHEVVATVSIGIALSRAQASRDDLLHDADVAMYQAKGRGPGELQLFDAGQVSGRSAERVDLETELRRGIERGEIEVHYQPIVATADGTITGAEALVRWNHPERGLVAPGHFIGLAEETGLILPLGRLVLETACLQAEQWRPRFGPLRMSVNLSARQFQQADLTDQIAATLDQSHLDPAQLCLEITETLAMANTERTIAILDELKRLRVLLAIDDFGTGYSSLGYLKRFPVDVVKVDRSFVAGLGADAVDDAIVSAVVNLAAAIGISTVAEGVETEAQVAHLCALGCPSAQGFWFARPMPAADMTALLAASATDPVRRARMLLGVGG